MTKWIFNRLVAYTLLTLAFVACGVFLFVHVFLHDHYISIVEWPVATMAIIFTLYVLADTAHDFYLWYCKIQRARRIMALRAKRQGESYGD